MKATTLFILTVGLVLVMPNPILGMEEVRVNSAELTVEAKQIPLTLVRAEGGTYIIKIFGIPQAKNWLDMQQNKQRSFLRLRKESQWPERASIEIQVPPAGHIDIISETSTLFIQDVHADLYVNTFSSPVTLKGFTGQATIHFQESTINITRSKGDFKLTGAAGLLNLQYIKGDLFVRSREALSVYGRFIEADVSMSGRYDQVDMAPDLSGSYHTRINAEEANIQLVLRPKGNARFSLLAGSGAVPSFPFAVDTETGSAGELIGTMGGGQAQIVAHTGEGDIRLRSSDEIAQPAPNPADSAQRRLQQLERDTRTSRYINDAFEKFRDGGERLEETIRFSGGNLVVTPSPKRGFLYGGKFWYETRYYEPDFNLSRKGSTLELEVAQRHSKAYIIPSNQRRPIWKLQIPSDIPLSLRFSLRGSFAYLDLGGLDLQDVDMNVDGQETAVIFSSPVRHIVDTFTLDVDVGRMTMRNLLNGNIAVMNLSFGGGTYHIDFGGQADKLLERTLHISLYAGTLDIVLSRDVGYEIFCSTLIFAQAGELLRDGDYFRSVDFAEHKRKVFIDIRGVAGKVDIHY